MVSCHHTHTECRITAQPNWGLHAHPCLLFKQAKTPPAPKSGSYAKSSLTLNIHSGGAEKANSGKVQDWRQREPHVRNSFLITGNALAHCIKMLWFIFIFSKVGLCFIVRFAFQCYKSNVPFPLQFQFLLTLLLTFLLSHIWIAQSYSALGFVVAVVHLNKILSITYGTWLFNKNIANQSKWEHFELKLHLLTSTTVLILLTKTVTNDNCQRTFLKREN